MVRPSKWERALRPERGMGGEGRPDCGEGGVVERKFDGCYYRKNSVNFFFLTLVIILPSNLVEVADESWLK